MGVAGGSPRSVVVADDHFVVRAGVRAVLASQPGYDVVAECADVAATVRAVAEHTPDLLVLDLRMPGGPVIAAVPGVLRQSPTTRVVALTMHSSPAFVRHALAAGVVGYVLKEALATELLTALASVSEGGTYVHPTLGAALLERPPEETDRLSAREREVLRLIAQGYTNAQVADLLHFSRRTVEAHRARIKDKLGVFERSQLVDYARSHGLLDPEDWPPPL